MTWYGRMDGLFMRLGFTKSKANSNLHFKVEGKILGMILLHGGDLFLIGEDELIINAKRMLSVGAQTLKVLNFGNSTILVRIL